ncbi:MAG: helix-turn-helix transcriptional regulator [Spirochaetes bacterium]|nr:helix-turn-helix transcriptional regulator [Spirochaetota bacterium]MBN2771107.1 helix-turn-helix transcriptional regulator [Spirochaetota bacterium]
MFRYLLFFNIATIIMGALAIYTSGILAIKYRQKILKTYTLFLIFYLLTILNSTFYVMEFLFFFRAINTPNIYLLFFSIQVVILFLISSSQFFLTNSFFNSEFWTVKRQALFIITILTAASLSAMLVYIIRYDWVAVNYMTIVSTIIVIAASFHFIIIALLNLKKEQLFRRKLIVFAIFLCLLTCMLTSIDFIPYFLSASTRHSFIVKGFMFSNLHIFLLYSLTIYAGLPYILKEPISHREMNFQQILNRYSITSREQEILEKIVQGYSNIQISAELNISLSTVKSHIYNMFQKTSSENRIELINVFK